MPMKRYKPEQIVTLLRQIEVEIANGKNPPQGCRDAEITVQTYYRWRKEYGGPAQAILGHSDLATTLNTYMHGIPDSQRRAVEKVADVLCPLVPNSGGTTAKVTVN